MCIDDALAPVMRRTSLAGTEVGPNSAEYWGRTRPSWSRQKSAIRDDIGRLWPSVSPPLVDSICGMVCRPTSWLSCRRREGVPVRHVHMSRAPVQRQLDIMRIRTSWPRRGRTSGRVAAGVRRRNRKLSVCGHAIRVVLGSLLQQGWSSDSGHNELPRCVGQSVQGTGSTLSSCC